MTSIEDFRHAKDEFFVHGEESPLSAEERSGFSGLQYFPPSDALVIEAQLQPPEDTSELRMPTSSGDEVVYRRAGTVQFGVDGDPARLTLFAGDSDGELFLPFRDATSGKETYGAGRYLEVPPPHEGRVVLDFNYAYNPYCAYSDAFSCPLPPTENWLRVPIRAGEKTFPGHAS